MDITSSTPLTAPPERVFAEVADLGTYPDWLSIVGRAEPASPHDDDAGPAWMVDLQARIGPLTRRHRVRMVRTRHEPPRAVRFERVEHDGREHSAWVLSADVAPAGDDGGTGPVGPGSRLDMHLHYSGGRLPLIEVVIREEIRRAGRRLEGRLG